SAEFTIGEGELMAHDVPLGCAPDEYDDLISGTCSHLPKATLDRDKFYKYIHNSASTAVAFTEVLLSKPRAALILLPVINHAGLMKRLTSLPG
ncbi:hypothetical protein ACI3SK_03460, partial [Klebsiella pneumoniae]|uniref:hypothetical protein n=1 Tax=Klebsiella pneumoniae TaxID=573 RepID=UPI003854A1DF